jgi:copper homeostasis protein (lipoprotein)
MLPSTYIHQQMRSLFPLTVLTVLWSCGTGNDTAKDGNANADDDLDTGAVYTDWPGYYDGTLPCADCEGIATQLWVRSDSTFILRQRYLGKDSLAFGTMGQWHVVNGTMTIGYTGDKPDFWRVVKGGIEMVDEMGTPFESKLNHTLEKLSDEIYDEVPRMRILGTFTYMADAKSFRPCGSQFTWPCAGGLDLGAEEGEVIGSMNGAELERAYLKAVGQGGKPWTIEAECSLDQGPAMEGDGMEEYLLIHRVLGPIGECP